MRELPLALFFMKRRDSGDVNTVCPCLPIYRKVILQEGCVHWLTECVLRRWMSS